MRTSNAVRGTTLAALVLLAACQQPSGVAGPGSSPYIPSSSLTSSHVVVSPKLATLGISQSLDLTAVALSSSGDTVATTVSWSSTSGSLIDAGTNGGQHLGRYTAGANAGTFKVIVTGTPGGKADTALVIVTATQTPPPPPPPPAVGGTWPNEPAGWSTITDYGFGDVIPTGADVPISAGWSVVNATGRIARITDATAPISASNVARFSYPQGFAAGSEPGRLYFPQSGTKDHYVGYEFKLSSPYSNNVVGTKMWYPFGVTASYFMLFGSDSKMWMYVQADAAHGGSYNLSGNVSNPTITLGAWHRIEILQRYPTTSSSSDGVFRWWIDGVLCGNYTNVGWGTTSTYQELRFAPTWGGLTGSVAFDSDWEIDHVHISRP